MKIVMLCGADANQKALAHRLHAVAPLGAIALIDIPPSRQPRRLSPRLASITIGQPLRHAWRALLKSSDRKYPSFPDAPISAHAGVNANSVMALLRSERPQLVLVSGTDLLRKPLIDTVGEIGGRILNLHAGLSPYMKGGPNCTNWALALQEFDMIGNTIMWLDAGIDSGAIVLTERTPLAGTESLAELHSKVMDHGHDCYCRCLARLRDGLKVPSVPQQEIGRGRLFLTRDWTASRIVATVANFYHFYRPENLAQARQVRLVSLEEAYL
jgi:folate-dependent phosphoribosylglycinamide formyltransferase PurN